MNIDTATPAELRDAAAQSERAAWESFERSDTDGALSQWASGMTARLYREQAEITENGGRATFPALFGLDGQLVPAKLVNGTYGMVWGLLPGDDPHGSFTGWFHPSRARNGERRRRTDEAKGYRVGWVRALAKAKVMGSGTGLSGCASAYVGTVRRDGGFSRDVEVTDDGTGPISYLTY